jgi:hypothetical protein
MEYVRMVPGDRIATVAHTLSAYLWTHSELIREKLSGAQERGPRRRDDYSQRTVFTIELPDRDLAVGSLYKRSLHSCANATPLLVRFPAQAQRCQKMSQLNPL